MKEFRGLDHLRDNGSGVYCPKCGNYLKVVANGFFHGELFYCPKEKLVFELALRDITKRAGKEYLKQCEEDIERENVRKSITRDNAQKVKEFLLKEGSK